MNFIAGINPLAVIIAIPLLLAVVWYLVIVPQWRNKNAKAVIGHILCEFVTMSGNAYEVLCKEERGEVVARGKKKDDVPVSDTVIKNPNKTDIGHCFVLPDLCYNTLYPANMPKAVQVTVKKAYFIENDPMPQMAINTDKWTDERRAYVSAQMYALAKDESTLRAQNELDREALKEITTVANAVKGLPMMKILIYGVVGISVVTAVLVFQQFTSISWLVSIFGG